MTGLETMAAQNDGVRDGDAARQGKQTSDCGLRPYPTYGCYEVDSAVVIVRDWMRPQGGFETRSYVRYLQNRLGGARGTSMALTPSPPEPPLEGIGIYTSHPML